MSNSNLFAYNYVTIFLNILMLAVLDTVNQINKSSYLIPLHLEVCFNMSVPQARRQWENRDLHLTLPVCTEHWQQIPWCDVREALLFPETFPYKQLAGEKETRLRARWKKTTCAFLLQHWMLMHLQTVERLKDFFPSVLVVWSLMTWHSSTAPSWALLHRLQCSRPPAAGY